MPFYDFFFSMDISFFHLCPAIYTFSLSQCANGWPYLFSLPLDSPYDVPRINDPINLQHLNGQCATSIVSQIPVKKDYAFKCRYPIIVRYMADAPRIS